MNKRLFLIIFVCLISLGLVSIALAAARVSAPPGAPVGANAIQGFRTDPLPPSYPSDKGSLYSSDRASLPGMTSSEAAFHPSSRPGGVEAMLERAKAASRPVQTRSQPFDESAAYSDRSLFLGMQSGLSPASVPPGVTVDLAYESLYGRLNPGDVVTVTRPADGAYGAAQADGVGFFWTWLFAGDNSGQPVDIVGGDVLEVYVNGSLETTLAPQEVSGGIDVLANQVFGAIAGDPGGTVVTITFGLWGVPAPEVYPVEVTSTDGGGSFDESIGFDLGAENLAAVDYPIPGGWVRGYLFPNPPVFLAQLNNVIAGYAPFGTSVTATVYITYPTDVLTQVTTLSTFPFGFYQFNGAALEPGDFVEVELHDGTLLNTTVADLGNITYDTDLDEVYGIAPAGETVRVSFREVHDGVETYTETNTVATPGGTFTAAFTDADLRPSMGVGLFIADLNGNETALVSGPPFVEAILDPRSDYDCVSGRVDGPNLPITLSIQTDSGTYTRTNPTQPSDAGNQATPGFCYLVWGPGWGPINFAPGDIVTLQSPTWQGQLTIADLTWEADNANDQVAGSAPPGDVGVSLSQWQAGSYPVNGYAGLWTVSNGAFSADFSGFDLRDGEGGVTIRYYDPGSDFVTNLTDFTRWMQAEPPWGVHGFTPLADEPVTAWLYDKNQHFLASTSQDDDGDPYHFWLGNFQGYQLLPGYWVTVTAQSGWTAGLQIPTLVLSGDQATDMVWGEAPKGLLYLDGGRENSGFSFFTPVDGYALNTAWLGHDLQWGDWMNAYYSALNGDRVFQNTLVAELTRVEFWLNQNGDTQMWGEAMPGLTVTITTPLGQFIATEDPSCPGCWYSDVGKLYPGDVVTVVAGPGLLPVVVTIPDPLTAQVDASLDQVWGQIGDWISRTVEVHGQWEDGYREVTTDLSGNYLASYDDIPRGGEGYVRFVDQVDVSYLVDVIYHRPFRDQTSLVIRANYAHDWVESNYEAGYTAWITVTNAAGEVKATASGVTAEIPWWGGQTGFATAYNLVWWPWQPDMQPGDWVYAALDNGQSTYVQLGEITGDLDVNSDSISGNVYASWFTQTLNGDCGVWVENGPGMGFTVDPDGGSYSCDFGALGWDLLPGEDVGVSYVEPDGDRVWNVFRYPAPELRVWTWGQGRPGTGGNMVLWVNYQNSGNAPSIQTYLSATLEGGLVYLGDTSGFPHSGSGTPGDPLVWQIGTLSASQFQSRFEVFVHVDAPAGQTVTNTVQIDSAVPYYQGDQGAKRSQWMDDVVAYNTDLSLSKGTWTSDPVPGTSYVYNINVCNQDQAGTLPVTLTDTLPVSVTLQYWWGQNLGWEEVSSSDHQLVLSRPSVPGYWCGEVYLRVSLDESAWPGMPISNTAAITASQDIDPWNNITTIWHNAGDPHTNLSVWKDWQGGQWVPGGEIDYSFSYGNNGNLPVDDVVVTNTLPDNTSFVRAWTWTPYGEQPITPTLITPAYLVWDVGLLENGFNRNINLALRIDSDAPVGSPLTHTVEIARQPLEDRYDDNRITWVDQVNDYGPNLWVSKQNYRWNGEGQLEYEIRVHNRGSLQLENVWITDTYPVSTTFNDDWWVNHGPWITATHRPDDRQILFWVDGLNPGETASIGFRLDLEGDIIGQEGLSFTNLLDAPFDGDVYLADNHDQVTAYTGPDVYIEKWLSGGAPEPGELLTYTVRFGNSNLPPWDGDPNYGSHITETLPEGMTFITATAPWDPAWDPEILPGNQLVWEWGPMWNNSFWEFDLVVQLTDTVQGGDVLTNTIEAYGDSPYDVEPNWENNVFELPLTVLAPVFDVGKTFQSSQVAGMPVTYDLSLANLGNQTATGVTLVDVVPEGVTYGGSDGSYAGGQVSWDITSLTPGSTAAGWFTGTLTCDVGVEVVNQEYHVADSEQGVTSPDGPPVSFTTLQPDIQTAVQSSAVAIGVGESVAFSATASTDGTALDLAWDFGDGGTDTGSQVDHIFTAPGSYEVELTAMDQCGYSDSETITILVSPRGVYLPLVLNLITTAP